MNLVPRIEAGTVWVNSISRSTPACRLAASSNPASAASLVAVR
jgi:hypothetical protein